VDVPLSIQDWWNSQGGRTLRQSNTDWQAANLLNPVPPPAPMVVEAPVAPVAPVMQPVVPIGPVEPPQEQPVLVAPVAPPVPAMILIPSGARSPEHRANVSASGSSNGESENDLVGLGPRGLEGVMAVGHV